MAAQELTPALRTILVGPIMMGDAAQCILWGVLTTQAARFTASPSWPKFSPAVRVAVAIVVGLATLSTCTAIADFWVYGTSFARTVPELENPLVLSFELLIVVGEEGYHRKLYLMGLFTLIAAEAGFWVWSVCLILLIMPLAIVRTHNVSHAFFLPQPAVYGISLLQTLSISDLSRRHSRDENPKSLQTMEDIDPVIIIPTAQGLSSAVI
ncbi:hypothetical protein RQP46_000989 [Phenoliferia psychrophenolica]